MNCNRMKLLSVTCASAIGLLAGAVLGAKAPELKIDDSPLRADVKARTSLAGVIKEANQSVVQIYTTTKVTVRQNPMMQDPLFRRFFGVPEGEDWDEELERQNQGLGSGVIVSTDGYVLTNNHVVDGADEIEVKVNGKSYEAEVVGGDDKTDIATLKIKSNESFPAITIGDSDTLEVGDLVLAIGNPFGVGQSVTSGIVSGTGRDRMGMTWYEDFIQTDAPINPGNSGGALVDAQGRLVGINTAIYSRSGGNNGIGFAIPINMGLSVLESLVEHGKVVRGYLGVALQPITDDIAELLGIEETSGALIVDVTPDTPAAKAGFQEEDVVVEYEGKPIEDSSDLSFAVGQTAPDTKVTFGVIRDKKRIDISVKLAALDDDRIAQLTRGIRSPSRVGPSDVVNGALVANLSEQTRNQFRIPEEVEGVVIVNVTGGSAARADLVPGAVIVKVNQTPIETVEDLERAIERARGDQYLLRVWANGSYQYRAVDK